MSKRRKRETEQVVRQQLSAVDAETLESFRRLPQREQQQIVDNQLAHAYDRVLPKREREIAKARAEQFKQGRPSRTRS